MKIIDIIPADWQFTFVLSRSEITMLLNTFDRSVMEYDGEDESQQAEADLYQSFYRMLQEAQESVEDANTQHSERAELQEIG